MKYIDCEAFVYKHLFSIVIRYSERKLFRSVVMDMFLPPSSHIIDVTQEVFCSLHFSDIRMAIDAANFHANKIINISVERYFQSLSFN